jgi:hypothetical protein
MRKFDIIVCSVLKMKGCTNAPACFAMFVCLVPVNVQLLNAIMCVCVCVCVCVGGGCIMCACVRECSLVTLSVAEVIHRQ